MSDNSDRNTVVKRDSKGRIFPGSGANNRRGRPRHGYALAEIIRRQIELDELVSIALSIARGLPVQVLDEGTGAMVGLSSPTPKDQIAALNWLAKYGGFEPPKELNIGIPDKPAIDFSGLSDQQLESLQSILLVATTGNDDGGD